MLTFDPLRDLMFLVKVANLGCPEKIASSGKNSDRETLFSGSGLYSGNVKPGHPNRGNEAIERTNSSGGSNI